MHLHSTGWTKASTDMECNLDFLDPRFGLKLMGCCHKIIYTIHSPLFSHLFHPSLAMVENKKTTHNILKKELLDPSAKGNIVLLRR